jgi:hypothetical protein
MRKLSIGRPSPALVVACIALFVALSGTGVATISQLARGSVGTPQLQNGAVTTPKVRNGAVTAPKIRNGAVTGAKVRNNSITSAHIRNRSLTRLDFAPGQLPAGPTGPQGPAGPAGPAGAAGPAGPAGVIGAITVRTNSVSVPAGQRRSVTRNCEGSERAISAGTSWSADDPLDLWTASVRPLLNPQNQVVGFAASGGNNRASQATTLTVHVLCYTP